MTTQVEKGKFVGLYDSLGQAIQLGSLLVDEAGQNWLVIDHPYIPAAYIQGAEGTMPIPLRGELKRKWMVIVN